MPRRQRESDDPINSEDEATLQDAVTWEPARRPARPTAVVRKAVIDDPWNQRGQLCRDWWEKAGSRKKLILNKIEKCLDKECPRQWTGEYTTSPTWQHRSGGCRELTGDTAAMCAVHGGWDF